MDWSKIDIPKLMKMFRELEKESIRIDGEHSITYSDGFETLKISYKQEENTSKGIPLGIFPEPVPIDDKYIEKCNADWNRLMNKFNRKIYKESVSK